MAGKPTGKRLSGGFVEGLRRVGEVYHYRFRMDGEVFHGSTGLRMRSLAEEWVKRLRDELVLERENMLAPTLETALAEWEKANKGVLSDKHLGCVGSAIRTHAEELLSVRLHKLDTESVEAVRSRYLMTEGSVKAGDRTIARRHSEGGANYLLKSLRTICQWAIRRGELKTFPFRIDKLRPQKRVRSVVPPSGVGRFLESVDQSRNKNACLAIRLMLGLGLREAEALGARWEWVSWSGRTYTPGLTKGREAVALPLPEWLLGVLAAHHESADKPMEGWVLPSEDGNPHRTGFTRKPVQRAGQAIGLAKLTPHRLRATFATLHANIVGTALPKVQAMLRHKDIKTTMIYVETSLEGLHEAQAKMADVLGLGQGGTKMVPNPETPKIEIEGKPLITSNILKFVKAGASAS